MYNKVTQLARVFIIIYIQTHKRTTRVKRVIRPRPVAAARNTIIIYNMPMTDRKTTFPFDR